MSKDFNAISIIINDNGKKLFMKNNHKVNVLLKQLKFFEQSNAYHCNMNGTIVKVVFSHNANAPTLENALVKIAAKKSV